MKADKRKLILLGILYLGFISLGLPDQSLGVAWPSMRQYFNKPLDWAGIIVFTTGILTAVSSFTSGFFIKRFSISTILIASCLFTATGILGYALTPVWGGVLLSTVLLGIGAGTIDASLNDYVAKHYTSKHMNWLHGCWGIGATMGPAIMTFALSYYHNWQKGYLIIAFIQFGLMLIFIIASPLWKNTKTDIAETEEQDNKTVFSLKPLMSIGIFFLYSAVEFSVGLWFYSVMVEYRGISTTQAGSWITLYWAFLTFGRFAIGFISNKLGNDKVILFSLCGAVGGMALLLLNIPLTMMIGLAVTGFSFSGIYPAMMHETPKRFGNKLGAVMTGFQAGAASLGVVILTPLIGVIITKTSLETLVPILLLLIVGMLGFNAVLNRKA